jgi:superfamily II DNA/RNA helicase
MESNEKSNSISNFIAGKSKILLASDIASRGLDIHNITLVINYDIPASNDTYVHRIGRSGRGALLGNSVTLIMSDEDKQKMKFIVDIHGIPIKALQTVKIESKSKY